MRVAAALEGVVEPVVLDEDVPPQWAESHRREVEAAGSPQHFVAVVDRVAVGVGVVGIRSGIEEAAVHAGVGLHAVGEPVAVTVSEAACCQPARARSSSRASG